jgi:type IV secretory pathway VirJ component
VKQGKQASWFLFFVLLLPVSAWSDPEETLRFGRFGTVTLYRSSPHPSQVALFVSGDGGWNQGVVEMARELASLDALVIGIDITHYLQELNTSTEACAYPAADFEALSQFTQKKLDFPRYIPPVLVGYSSGATLVYATLVQAPPGTFRGALSMGFCPDLPLTKPLCGGHGLEWTPGPKGKGYSFLPAPKLETPWIAFQGTIDQVCDPGAVETYVRHVGRGRLIMLPNVGHGFSVERNWLPQFKEAFASLGAEKPAESPPSLGRDAVNDLPLVEVPVTGMSTDILAVIISGDGGWASLDRELGNTLASQGIAVVGLNSLQYFWTRRTPEGAAQDLERILRYYLAAWKKDKVLLIGYSLGADVLPFMANRLSQQTLSRVQLVALLGPGHQVDFEFHLTNWLWDSPTKTARPVLPEVEKLRGTKTLCFYGDEEKDTLCKDLDPSLATVRRLKGGHHFDGDYQAMAATILHEASDTIR